MGKLEDTEGRTEASGDIRLLLLEFLTTERLYQQRNELFPFLRGYAGAEGVRSRWLSFGYDPANLGDEPFLMRLEPQDETSLLDAVRELRPTHIITNGELSEGLGESLRSAAPRARLGVAGLTLEANLERVESVAAWLGLPETRTGFLVDETQPRHDCELANELARSLEPFLLVVSGPVCLYRRPLSQHPLFAELDLDYIAAPAGCTFCGVRSEARYPYRTPVEELARRQVLAAWATAPAERPPRALLFSGSPAFLRLGPVLDALVDAAIPPSDMYFYCRIDEVHPRGDEITALLPRLRDAGHAIHLFAMGVENFAPAENERFNKGITLDDIERTFALLRDWEERFPQTLHFRDTGGFSFILFTPWTRLEDLRFNVECARRFDFHAKPFFFTSRLQLFDDRPIAALARKDGLVCDDFADPAFWAYDSGCITEASQHEIPWRFDDPTVAAVYSLCIRMFPTERLPKPDPLTDAVQTLVAAAPTQGETLFDLLDAILDAAESAGATPSPAELLAVLAPRFQLGEDQSDSDAAHIRHAASVLLERAATHPRHPLRGFEVERVATDGSTGNTVELHVSLRGAEGRLVLHAVPHGGQPRALVCGDRLEVRFDPATPLDTGEKMAVARVVLRVAERAFGVSGALGG